MSMIELVAGAGPSRPLPVPPAAGGAVVFGPAAMLMGWMITEATGAAPATVAIWSGASNQGNPVGTIPLAAGALSSPWFGPFGIPFTGGLFAAVTLGAVTGSFFVAPAGAGNP